MHLAAQGTADSAAARWTAVQIHDTVARIVSQPVYNASVRESLAGRLGRYLADRWNALVSLFRGSLHARVVLVVCGAVIVALIIARITSARHMRDDQRQRHLGPRRAFGSRQDFWAIAAEHAANGRYADACHAVYAAVVDAFAGQGLMSLHASKTSGDYVRELNRAGAGAAVAADFRVFSRQFDRLVFGGDVTVLADDYQRLRESGERAVRLGTNA